ncbi:MAG: aminoglycoside phosphotransferase [Candidatus Eremiobacteraeota bacterium]|nr:aminoglycoside phosphotransferase [Candidatus Eremiobacteraeota bacterium]MCW5867124.1 aminoglycoside phosphotransferase [Candidatus Eremiobacteraeota bacterium]
MRLPQAFVDGVLRENGQAWLATVPEQLYHYCHVWGLKLDGPPRHGYLGLAFPVRRAGGPAVLKLTRINEETRDEAAALRFWNGRGAVQLLEAEPGVLLLERLDAGRTLAALELDAAVSVASGLLRRLSLPAPAEFLDMREYTVGLLGLARARWERFQPFPADWLRLPEVRQNLLVNQDLHYANVLAGSREEWLVIDPKPLRGDPEFALAPLLWNRWEEGPVLERFEQLVRGGALDRAVALEWTLFRVLEYWLWALDLGFTEDPGRCRALAEQLLQG